MRGAVVTRHSEFCVDPRSSAWDASRQRYQREKQATSGYCRSRTSRTPSRTVAREIAHMKGIWQLGLVADVVG